MAKKILVISFSATHPQNCGNRIRSYNLLHNLQKLGHEIHFLYYPEDSGISSKFTIEKGDIQSMKKSWDKFYLIKRGHLEDFLLWIDMWIGKIGIFLRKNIPGFKFRLKPESKNEYRVTTVDIWYPEFLNKAIKKLNKKIKFDAVIIEYIYLSKALESFDNSVLKLIDTHDVCSNLYKEYEKNNERYYGLVLNQEEEAKGLNRADIILAIQDKEREFFSKLVNKDKKVITIGHNVTLVKPIINNKNNKTNKSKNLLFVGSNIGPNLQGINYFIKEVFPKIKLKFPDAKLLICGAVCNSVEDSPGIIKLGEVKDIKTAYDLADIVVNPVSFGSGLKIKSIESLGYSKPLVTLPHGAIGLEKGIGKAFLVAKNSKEFSKLIIKILSDSKLSTKLSQNAYNFAENYNNENIKKLKEIFKD